MGHAEGLTARPLALVAPRVCWSSVRSSSWTVAKIAQTWLAHHILINFLQPVVVGRVGALLTTGWRKLMRM